MGYRFGLHRKGLPGKPDIVMPKYKTVIFVHGCFWHRHNGCPDATVPKTRREFWEKKLEGNALRDRIKQRALRLLGWQVIVLWECKIQNTEKFRQRLNRLLSTNDPTLRTGS
jgi:DNA mismatch endonuclease (patch repair protein)